ncbi:MAG: hypothetical protein DHS20C16_25040 [Phycisphaerae bacterium]|nr:MAG: hypothetical protein DHS20C16_25040 [Phycisphaerae bacterium]
MNNPGMSSAGIAPNVCPSLALDEARAASESRLFFLSDRQLTFAFALLLALSVIVIHRVNQRAYVGYHGLTHSAITFSVMAGNIPPTNPFAAELPLPYYWGYHVLMAQGVSLTGWTPVAIAEIFNVLTIFGLTFLFAHLGRRLIGSARAGLLAVVLILFAMNPFGPLLMAYRVFEGTLGLSIGEFTRSPTHPMLRGMFPGLDIRWAGTYFFHMQPSSRPLAMLAGSVAAVLACGSFSRVSIGRGIGLAVAVAVACAMQPIVGVGTAFGLGAGMLFVRFIRRSNEGITTPVVVKLIAFMGIGVLMAYPTYQQLLNGNLVGLPIEKSAAVIATKGFHVFAMLAIVPLVLTFLAMRRGFLRNPQMQMLAVGGVVLIATSWITNVPGHREHSFFNMGTYLLALPAAAACGFGMQIGARQVLRRCMRTLACIAPVSLVMVVSFGYRYPIALASDGELMRYPKRTDTMAVYDWIVDNTPTDTVLMFDTRDGEQIGFYGVESEVPAMTKRFLFMDVVEWFIPANHPEVAARQDVIAALFDGKQLTAEQIRIVEKLNRPVYALTREPSEDATLAAKFGPAVYRQGKYALYALNDLN